MKILLYGASHLAAVSYERVKNEFDFVGHIPSRNARIPGIIDLPVVEHPKDCPHDIKLSIQYDKKIFDYKNAFNVHTGLLPEWGGGDILYHTIKNGEYEQGITFHKMTDKFDYGPIISKITYPVFEGDSVVDLYERMTNIIPSFVHSSLKLLESVGLENIDKCYKQVPKIFKREKDVGLPDLKEYKKMGNKLVALYGAQSG